MSTPISSLPDHSPDEEHEAQGEQAIATDREEDRATPEAGSGDPTPASNGDVRNSGGAAPASAEARRTGGRSGLTILVLVGLLLGSIAINLKQSRDVSTLEARSSEYQQALAAAVERIDSETARADGAEAALDRVDGAVDLVNERVLDLQQALDGLREATVR